MFEFNYGNGWSIGSFHWFRGVVRQPNESSSNQNNIYKSLDYFLSFFFGGGGGSSLKLKKKWLLANLRVFIFKRQSKYNPNQYFDQISNCSRNNCQFNQRTKHIRIFGLTKTQFPFETNVGHLPPPPSQKNSPFWVFFFCVFEQFLVSFFSGQPIPGASFFFGRRRRRRYEHEPPITINEQLETFCFQVVGEQNAAECLQPVARWKNKPFFNRFFSFFLFCFRSIFCF